MNSEENLRRFLQDRFNAEALLPDEAEWEQTRSYLDARRRATRRRFAAFSLLALIPVAALLLWPRTDSGKEAGEKTFQVPPSGAGQQAPAEHRPAPRISRPTANVDAVEIPPAARTTGHRPAHPAQPGNVSSDIVEATVDAMDADKEGSTLKEQIMPPDREAGLPEPKIAAAVTVPADHSLNRSHETERPGGGVETMPEPVTNITMNKISAGQLSAVADVTVNTDVEPTPANGLSIVQATQEAVTAKPDSVKPGASSPRPQAREGISYELGAGWLYGWSTAEGRDARGFTPIAGINYATRLEQRSAVSFGVQYARVPGLSSSSRTSRVTSFRFGEESRVTVITPLTLYYLVVPLRFHYALGAGFTAGGGMNLGYLLNVDARVTTYDEKPGYTGNYETIQLSGYREGFRWYDSQAALFFSKDLCRSFGLRAELFYGLSDVKQDEFFRQASANRNSGLKLTLLYHPSLRSVK